MKTITFFILILISSTIFGQVAIIDDQDGFCNIRVERDSHSEVLLKVYDNYVFWYNQDEFDDGLEWISVMIPKNRFSFGFEFPQEKYGFLHRTRIKPLENLSSYSDNDFSFKYDLKPFEKEKHIYDLDKEYGKYIISIDGRPPHGVDGGYPSVEIEKIDAVINGKKLQVDEVYFCDIFECTNGFYTYKKDDVIFLYQRNSDGAGAYEIVWVISKNKITQRLVGSMI